MKKIVIFVRECIGELKKVVWPTKDDVVAQTIVVIVSLVIVALCWRLWILSLYRLLSN